MQVCEAMAAGTERPIILPLSRISAAGQLEASEVTAADALAWTRGRALFADKLTSGPVEVPGGETRQLRAIDTTYIFPGQCSVRSRGGGLGGLEATHTCFRPRHGCVPACLPARSCAAAPCAYAPLLSSSAPSVQAWRWG